MSCELKLKLHFFAPSPSPLGPAGPGAEGAAAFQGGRRTGAPGGGRRRREGLAAAGGPEVSRPARFQAVLDGAPAGAVDLRALKALAAGGVPDRPAGLRGTVW